MHFMPSSLLIVIFLPFNTLFLFLIFQILSPNWAVQTIIFDVHPPPSPIATIFFWSECRVLLFSKCKDYKEKVFCYTTTFIFLPLIFSCTCLHYYSQVSTRSPAVSPISYSTILSFVHPIPTTLLSLFLNLNSISPTLCNLHLSYRQLSTLT